MKRCREKRGPWMSEEELREAGAPPDKTSVTKTSPQCTPSAPQRERAWCPCGNLGQHMGCSWTELVRAGKHETSREKQKPTRFFPELLLPSVSAKPPVSPYVIFLKRIQY